MYVIKKFKLSPVIVQGRNMHPWRRRRAQRNRERLERVLICLLLLFLATSLFVAIAILFMERSVRILLFFINRINWDIL